MSQVRTAILVACAVLWGLAGWQKGPPIPGGGAPALDGPAAPTPRAAAPAHRTLATAITPITNLTGGASGIAYSGDSYEVACTITGSATLYPAVYDAATSSWEVYQGYPCTLDDSIITEGVCIFPARQGAGLTWNAFKKGTGTVSACTAAGRQGPVPASRAAPSSSGAGTVTSISCDTGLVCTPDPITTTGSIGPDFGVAAGQVVEGGVVSGASCAYPTSVTYNDAGQVTACTAGSAPTAAPSPVIIASLTGVATSVVYVTSATAGSTGTTSSGAGLRAFGPAGSVWQLRSAVTTAITAAQQCDTTLKTATTPGGVPSTQLTSSFLNADGANANKITGTFTVGASLVYLTIAAVCTFSYAGLIYFQLERVS